MPVSSAPGSARDLTWTVVLPANGTFPVDLVGPTFWFGAPEKTESLSSRRCASLARWVAYGVTGSPTFGLLLPAELKSRIVREQSGTDEGAEDHRAADWCRSGGIRRRLFPHLGSGTFITLRVLAAVALLILAPPVHAETQLAAYLGVSTTAASDVTLVGQTFRGVQWETRSLQAPPYYGLRAAYFFERSGWGLAVDFFHDKAYATSRSLAPALNRLSFSHGLNHLTLDLDWRTRTGPLQPYLALGAGTLIPHVEAQSDTASVDEYQWFRGISLKAAAGFQWRFAGPAGLFVEYRLTFAHLHASTPGGNLSTSLWTNHLAAGALLAL